MAVRGCAFRAHLAAAQLAFTKRTSSTATSPDIYPRPDICPVRTSDPGNYHSGHMPRWFGLRFKVTVLLFGVTFGVIGFMVGIIRVRVMG